MILKSKEPVDVRLTSLIGLKKAGEMFDKQNEEQHKQELRLQPQDETCIEEISRPREAPQTSIEKVTSKRNKSTSITQSATSQAILEENISMVERHTQHMRIVTQDSMAPLTLPKDF